MSKAASFTFVTTLRNMPQADVTVAVNGLPADKVKKQARVAVSAQHTSPSLGFLHANLVQLDGKYFLFAGPSGVGKTTYASALGARPEDILANDWVAVEYSNGDFYASDLNEAHAMRHQQRCPIDGILFLTGNDETGRDAFAPDIAEYTALLDETFDGEDITPQTSTQLQSFWLGAYAQLPFVAAIPARRHDQQYTTGTIKHLISRLETPHQLNVGVIGTGALGSELAYQLGLQPFIERVYMYNRNAEKAKGYALDMNQALPNSENGRVFVATSQAETIFKQSSVVFLVFRDQSSTLLSNMPERWQRLQSHLKTIRHYAEIAARTDFRGTVFVVTNPVDILTYAFHEATKIDGSGLRTYQAYGIGLEVDMARTLHFARRLDFPLTEDDLTIFGNHSDHLEITTPLPAKQQAQLLQATQGASAEIRAHGPRTVYGPVAAAIRTIRAYANNQTTYVTLLQEGAYIGRKINFRYGLPQLADTPPATAYKDLIRQNTETIAANSKLLYNA